jgi:hypothetical protein
MLIAETAYEREFLCVRAIGIPNFRYTNRLLMNINLMAIPQRETVIPCE